MVLLQVIDNTLVKLKIIFVIASGVSLLYSLFNCPRCLYIYIYIVLRPSLEYGSEVCEGNKSQAASLESIMLGGAKRVLGCSSKTSNEAIWGDMGLEFLQGRRDKRKLSWWYKVVNMPLSRYPKQLFQEEWNIKSRPGRQRKVWKRVVDDIFKWGG